MFLAEQALAPRAPRLTLPLMEGARMLRHSTITVAAIAACGVTLALGASVAVLPHFVQPIAVVTSVVAEPSPPKAGPRQIPHKFMRPAPAAP